MPLFDSNFLTKLEYLSLISKRVFRGSLLAQRRTMQLGGGVEFADHREYTPGDDFRYLDWNLYARHEELLLKRFQEEEDLHVYFLLDCSKSMGVGTPIKFDLARRIVAALSYIALADLDRISVVAFASNIIDSFPLTRGKGRILTLLQFLENLQPVGEETDLERVVSGFVTRNQRRGLAIVVSDLYDPKGYRTGLDMLRHRRYEASLVQLFDRSEEEPQGMLGDLELIDIESGAGRKVTVTETHLRKYKQLYAEFQKGVTTYCNQYALGHSRARSDMAYDEFILNMMRAAGALA